MEFACWNSSQLDAYAAATGRTSLSVAAAVLTAAHNYSMPAIAQQMAFRFGVTRTARQWRNIIHQCISQQPQFISPDLRFRASNRVVDERVPVALHVVRQMVDSFPVRIPRPNTQRMRQAFYSVPHHEVCVKFNVAITHEELCTMVGEEFRGAGNDKTDWHTAAHSVQHYVMDDLILADTAYSGAAEKWKCNMARQNEPLHVEQQSDPVTQAVVQADVQAGVAPPTFIGSKKKKAKKATHEAKQGAKVERTGRTVVIRRE